MEHVCTSFLYYCIFLVSNHYRIQAFTNFIAVYLIPTVDCSVFVSTKPIILLIISATFSIFNSPFHSKHASCINLIDHRSHAGLREQAQGFDLVQLYEAKQAIRPGKEQEAENRAQQVCGEKYSPLLMFDSKKAVSRMLHEDIERQAVRRMVRQAQKGQQTSQKKKSKKRER